MAKNKRLMVIGVAQVAKQMAMSYFTLRRRVIGEVDWNDGEDLNFAITVCKLANEYMDNCRFELIIKTKPQAK